MIPRMRPKLPTDLPVLLTLNDGSPGIQFSPQRSVSPVSPKELSHGTPMSSHQHRPRRPSRSQHHSPEAALAVWENEHELLPH